ncbi:hypothetical protein RRG08_001895, partial [Elysia crispata]
VPPDERGNDDQQVERHTHAGHEEEVPPDERGDDDQQVERHAHAGHEEEVPPDERGNDDQQVERHAHAGHEEEVVGLLVLRPAVVHGNDARPVHGSPQQTAPPHQVSWRWRPSSPCNITSTAGHSWGISGGYGETEKLNHGRPVVEHLWGR